MFDDDQEPYDQDPYSQPAPTQPVYRRPSRPWRRRVAFIVMTALATATVTLFVVIGMTRNPPQQIVVPAPIRRSAPVPIPWTAVRHDASEALRTARQRAEAYAKIQLEAWTAELEARAYKHFLPEQLSYWNQQVLAAKRINAGALHMLDGSRPAPDDVVTEHIQESFAKLVLRPPIAQARVEQIADSTIRVFLHEAASELKEVPRLYGIREPQWDHFIGAAAEVIDGCGRTRQVPITVKIVTVSSVGGASLLARPVARLAQRIAARLTGKAVARGAAATGARAAGIGVSRVVAPAIALVVVWDLIEHRVMTRRLTPLIQEAVSDYFQAMREALLREIMATVCEMEVQIVTALPQEKEKR